jgi:hypothetical protein
MHKQTLQLTRSIKLAGHAMEMERNLQDIRKDIKTRDHARTMNVIHSTNQGIMSP